jgi:signal transduction histidine kinase
MSSQVLGDEGMGADDVLTAPEAGAAPLLLPSLPDVAAVATEHDERLNEVGGMVVRVAHDLRQYLCVARGAAELIQEGVITVDTMAILLRAIDQMTRMIHDLLRYARGVETATLEEVPVRALVGELDEIALRKLEGRGIRVERSIHFSGAVRCDRHLLVRALANLIVNAGEAMQEGGRLTLTADDGGDMAIFSIHDTGIGIPAEILPTIFQPFVSHQKQGGTGLGLAITREIVQAHGGSIAVESTVGRGTTFVVTIPQPRPAPEARPHPSAAAEGPAAA